jgi:hypothetical protein
VSHAALGQVAPASSSAPTEKSERTFKYEGFVGYGYTSLNQVNQSRSGLQGVEVSLTRDLGKYFGIMADGGDYTRPIKSGNPGNPSVDSVLLGPVFHAQLYGRFSGFVRVLLGGEHTGGESETPNISFAGGVGGGMEYSVGSRFAIRASGDDILSSFSLTGNSKSLGYSPHKLGNGRAAIGIVYRF